MLHFYHYFYQYNQHFCFDFLFNNVFKFILYKHCISKTMFKIFKISLNFLLFLTFASILSSCGIYRSAPVSEVPINEKEKRKKNIEEGRGITVFGGESNKGGGNFVFASSNPMWRATLDILDFTPLSNVDYGGGIIITDWYSDESNLNESLKVSVQFLANEIRADGIEIKIFKKKCNQSQACKVVQVNSDLNQEIKLAILNKAAKIQKGDRRKQLDESGKKIIILDPK